MFPCPDGSPYRLSALPFRRELRKHTMFTRRTWIVVQPYVMEWWDLIAVVWRLTSSTPFELCNISMILFST